MGHLHAANMTLDFHVSLHHLNVRNPKRSDMDLVEFGLHDYLQIYDFNKMI